MNAAATDIMSQLNAINRFKIVAVFLLWCGKYGQFPNKTATEGAKLLAFSTTHTAILRIEEIVLIGLRYNFTVTRILKLMLKEAENG